MKKLHIIILFLIGILCWNIFVYANWPLSHVEYTTYIWGTATEHPGGMYKWWMAQDSEGNIYILGMVDSTDYPTTAWAVQTTYAWWSYDCAISKFDAALSTLLASTYLWGTSDDRCSDIEIDANDRVYITMNTTSSNLPTSVASYDTTVSNRDTYIARLDSNLTTVQASTYFWGSSNELYGTDMEFAADGSIYFTAATASSNLPLVWTPYQSSLAWSYDIFVAHMDADLTTVINSTYIWGSSVELYNNTLTIDNEGNIVVRGHSLSTNYPVTPWAYDTSHNGSYDLVLSRFDPTLTTLMHSTYLWWVWADYYSYYGWQVIFDDNNNLYVIWSTPSSDFPVTVWAYDTNFVWAREMFIASLTTDFSTLRSSTFVWGDSSEMWSSIEFMPNGNIVFLWATPAVVEWWATIDAFDSTNSGRDNMLWIITPDLSTMVQLTYMWWTDGSDYNYETDESLIVDGECIYFTSSTTSANETFPLSTHITTSPPYQANNAWSRDTTITKMCPASCGDFVTQSFEWETCDDGNTVSGDGCSDICILEQCGDWVVDRFYESFAPTNWLVVYHTFDDITGYDDSGRRNNLTTAWTVWSVAWVIWTASNYDDPGDMSFLDASVSLNGLHYTIAARAEFPLPNTWTRRTMTRWINNDHQILVRSDGEIGMYDNLYGGNFFSAWFDIDTLSPWRHHIAAVWNNWADTTTFYIDGVVVWTAWRKSDGEISVVWNYWWWSQARWILDEFRIYNRILSASEIQDIYTAINVYPEECDDGNTTSNDGCSWTDQITRRHCTSEYCRDDAPIHDTSKNLIVTDLSPTLIAWTSNQPDSEIAICFEDTTTTRDIFYTTTDASWNFSYVPNLTPYSSTWINVWIMLHDENYLDIDHRSLVLQQ